LKTTSSAKDNILKKIKQALAKPVPVPFEGLPTNQNIFQPNDDLAIQFAEKFSGLQGRFSFCENEKEAVQQLKTLFAARQWAKIFLNESRLRKIFEHQDNPIATWENLADCDVSITSCEYLVARTGSIVLSSIQNGRTPGVYAPAHICIAYTNQLVFDIKDGLHLLKKKYPSGFPSLISFASGPSRTADIEKTLVTGIHGPKEVFCFLIYAE